MLRDDRPALHLSLRLPLDRQGRRTVPAVRARIASEARVTAAMAAELRRALAARGMSGKALGDAIGMSHSTVYDILRNDRVPTVQTAALMADALGWPNLVNIARRDRTKVCVVCGASFVDAGRNGVARCCGPTCQGTRYQRSVRGSAGNLRGRAEVAENRLELHRRAVAAFCAGCEPESFCRDASCSLRPVSPLPLADRRLRVA